MSDWVEYAVLLADGSASAAAGPDIAREQAAWLNDLSVSLEAVHQPIRRSVHSTPVDGSRAIVTFGQWTRLRRSQPVDVPCGHDNEGD